MNMINNIYTEMEETQSKKCSLCKTEKPMTDYINPKSKKECKVCRKCRERSKGYYKPVATKSRPKTYNTKTVDVKSILECASDYKCVACGHTLPLCEFVSNNRFYKCCNKCRSERRRGDDAKNYQNGKIYRVINTDNNTVFIGSTVDSLNKKINHYKRKSQEITLGLRLTEVPLLTAMNTIGKDKFRIELIKNFPCHSKVELEAEECRMIKELQESGTTLYNEIIIIPPRKAPDDPEDRPSLTTDMLEIMCDDLVGGHLTNENEEIN